MSERKERISCKINSYFTIKVPEEQLSPQSGRSVDPHKSKCRLRYALEEEEECVNTMSTF